MVDSLKSYSEFDIIDGSSVKNFLAENLVMNYSNIEIHKILFQQMISGQRNKLNRGDNIAAAKQINSSSLSRLEIDDKANADG